MGSKRLRGSHDTWSMRNVGENVHGRCLCGDVAWRIEGALEWMAHCHCTMCRKAHGTAFATFVTFAASAFRWERGQAGVKRFESSPGSFRTFCGRCGSKLPSVEPFAYAHAGALEGELGVRPTEHMFAAAKAPWHDITDGAPQLDSYPPSPGADSPPVPCPTPRHTEPAAGRVRGSCLCGAAAYEIDGPLAGGAIVCCHCSRCRRARAAAHASNLFVEPACFRWLRGTDALRSFAPPDAARFAQSFCGTCGSPMPAAATPPGATRKQVPAGSLDDDPGVREGLHIFVASKAPWHAITDALPQHAEYPPGDFPPVARRTAG